MQSLVWLSVIYIYSFKFCILITFLQFQLEYTLLYRTLKFFSYSASYGSNSPLHIHFAFYVSVKIYFTLKTSHIDFYKLFVDSTFLFISNFESSFLSQDQVHAYFNLYSLLFNLIFL